MESAYLSSSAMFAREGVIVGSSTSRFCKKACLSARRIDVVGRDKKLTNNINQELYAQSQTCESGDIGYERK